MLRKYLGPNNRRRRIYESCEIVEYELKETHVFNLNEELRDNIGE